MVKEYMKARLRACDTITRILAGILLLCVACEIALIALTDDPIRHTLTASNILLLAFFFVEATYWRDYAYFAEKQFVRLFFSQAEQLRREELKEEDK